jgi:hypothetical protein
MKRALHLFAPLAVVAATATAGPAAARMPVVRAASPIDGRWQASITRTDLLRIGERDPALLTQLPGLWTAHLANGRFQARNERTGRGAKGTFSVSGKLIRFVYATGIGIEPGQVSFCNASVYRDRLTFATVPGRTCRWQATVWTRIS